MKDNLCGCGKPIRYSMGPNFNEGACNKYKRCPTYKELEDANKVLFKKLNEACIVADDLSLYRESTSSYEEALRRLKDIKDFLRKGD